MLKSKPYNPIAIHDYYTRLIRAKQFIEKYYGLPLNLAAISEEACWSPYHFLRLFKKTYQTTPHQYLIHRRIEKAKELLAETKMSVREICFRIGFESIGSFTTLFKKQVGKTPLTFREHIVHQTQMARDQPENLVPHCFLFMHHK